MESRKEKRNKILRHEGNAKVSNHFKKVCELCHERAQAFKLAQTPVSYFDVRFLVNMNYAFQDRENIYLVMDLLSGGDLRYHISKH